MDVKVSVIVPIYNVEKYLDECLKSIQQQTLTEMECICIDDGSTDCSGEIALRYVESDARFKYIRRENGGLSRARNDGIDIAQGKYILFCDSDDCIVPKTLESLVLSAESKQLDVLFFEASTIYDSEYMKVNHSSYEKMYHRQDDYSEVCSGEELFVRLNRNNDYIVSACLQLLKRTHIEENNLRFLPGILYEDNLFTFKSILKANRASCINEAFYIRRIREDSIMTVPKIGFVHFFSSYKCYLEMLKESYLYNELETKSAMLKCIKGMYNSARDKYTSIRRRYINLKEYKAYVELFDSTDRMLMYQMGFEINFMYMFPYKVIKPDKKVVIYGAGNVGQSYVHQIEHGEYCKVVMWVDRNYSKLSNKYGKTIAAPGAIMATEYDYVLIAVEDKVLAESIKKGLVDIGVPNNKIVWEKPRIMNV